jgi:hypothetical protein
MISLWLARVHQNHQKKTYVASAIHPRPLPARQAQPRLGAQRAGRAPGGAVCPRRGSGHVPALSRLSRLAVLSSLCDLCCFINARAQCASSQARGVNGRGGHRICIDDRRTEATRTALMPAIFGRPDCRRIHCCYPSSRRRSRKCSCSPSRSRSPSAGSCSQPPRSPGT